MTDYTDFRAIDGMSATTCTEQRNRCQQIAKACFDSGRPDRIAELIGTGLSPRECAIDAARADHASLEPS